MSEDGEKEYLFDQEKTIGELIEFFREEKPEVINFGKYVNQTFEAFTFGEVIKWYKNKGWEVQICNPTIQGEEKFRLKFSTRGAPKNYSYALCFKGQEVCQIRHQLRVSIISRGKRQRYPSNICCDIAVIGDLDLSSFSTDDAVENKDLLSFGEVKHMSGYAELMASFIGLVFELKKTSLKRIRIIHYVQGDHIPPFLHLSGVLYPTAKGILESIRLRKYDLDIYSYDDPINED